MFSFVLRFVFSLCVLAVVYVCLGMFLPQSFHVAFSVGGLGAGLSFTWAGLICLVSFVFIYRFIGNSA